jgi:hypothetical protein
VLNGVTPDSDILADTVKDLGPCLNDEGETDATVRFPSATLLSFSPLASGAGEISSRLDT